MNKAALIKAAAKRAGVTQKDTEKVVDVLFGTQATDGIVIETVSIGDKVELVGFGNFYQHRRSGRTGRNPQTGQPVEIKPKHIPKFKPGRRFNDAIPQE